MSFEILSDDEGIETLAFVERLKQQDQVAWSKLRDHYGPHITEATFGYWLNSDLPFDVVKDMRSIKRVSKGIWKRAERTITWFRFTERGSLFKWLSQISYDIVREYVNWEIETAAFVHLLQDLDPIAWTRLIDSYSPELEKACRWDLVKHGYSPNDAPDLIHDMWIKAREKIGDFEHRTNERKGLFFWLKSILDNLLRNKSRKWKLRNHASLDDERFEGDHPVEMERFRRGDTMRTVESEVEDRLFRADYEQAVVRVMAKFKAPHDKLVIAARFFEGVKPGEIAQQLDIDISRVYQVTRRAKELLRNDGGLSGYLPNRIAGK